MKFIGIAMIFAAVSSVGFIIGEKYISVLNGIKRADNLLGAIILGLQNERMTLPEIFISAAAAGDKKTKQFAEIIKPENLEKAHETAANCGFCRDKTANRILSETFSVLGRYPANEQIKEIEAYRKQLRAHIEVSSEQIRMKAKLSRYSGVFAGASIVIILL